MAKRLLSKLLRVSEIIVPLKATSKDEAIEELLGCLGREGLISDHDVARNDVFERERKMSTGMKDGLAVPHAKTDGVKELCLALGIKPEGIEFESLDGRPARIIFLVLSRADKTGPHLQCLAEVTGVLRNANVREALLKARNAPQVLSILDAAR